MPQTHKKVRISDIFSNLDIKIFSIDLNSTDQHLLDQDYIEEAWRLAVQQQLVDQNHREKYKFEIVVE